MRLIDFNLSTIDLHPALQLYWEHDGQITAVIDLRTTHQQLRLITGKGRPLSLDQLRTRSQQVDPHVSLFIDQEPPQRLYGYRLVPHQILFG
ncbi:hypothetical protein [Levilactobacillus tujiorum]|uniref:hypothetical protein n=1 Tax=Levilactobacillus tujiorum TaxID=2912243 RepID=UPI0014571A03|nr:hypothetical protein [Levilactobacillus tujiorum]NLR33076.1 hypothetical protein [Levilactobacillus tujiorum]